VPSSTSSFSRYFRRLYLYSQMDF